MSKMVAMVVPQKGAKLERVERDVPRPGPREILLRIQACGVCHSDSFTVAGTRPGISYPRVPGHEVIGVVEAFGSAVEGWTLGKRGGVGWFGGSCGYCEHCRRSELFACENVQAITGVTRDGGYASHMLADVTAVAHIPDDLDSVAAAPLLCAGITTFNALRNSGARPGETVVIHGVGGLGHLGIQYARRMGFRTIAVNRGKDKAELALKLGAHEYITSDDGDIAKALLDRGGAKAIIATVANAKAQEEILGGLCANGVFLEVGASGTLAVESLKIMYKRAAVRGWYCGVATDSEDTLRFSGLMGVEAMNEVYPFAKAQDAYDRMMSGQARFRVVMQMD